jgi:subtilisin family serine protease
MRVSFLSDRDEPSVVSNDRIVAQVFRTRRSPAANAVWRAAFLTILAFLALAILTLDRAQAAPSANAGKLSAPASATMRIAQSCPPQLQKPGLCKGSGGNRRLNRGGNFSGSNAPRVVCINGKRIGSRCICPGGKLRRVNRYTYKCTSRPRPCKPGQRRIGGKCIGPTPPPSDPDRCIAGRVRRTGCYCPPPARPRKIGRRSYRCVIPPCPKDTIRKGRLCVHSPPSTCPPDTHRVGRRCVSDARPDPAPPGPECRPGWRLRNGKCTRNSRTACPDGTRRADGHCVLITPPPRNADRPPLPRPSPTIPSADDSAYEPDEVLVEIAGNAPQQVANRLITSIGLVTLSQTRLTILGTSLYRFRIPAGSGVEDVVASITGQPGVEGTQPNWRYRINDGAAAALPPEKSSTNAQPVSRGTLPQYALDRIGARKANVISRGANVLVAVIDTGIEETHPELAGSIAGHYNAFPSQPFAPDTHATAVASIIAARRDMAGIAPDARILSAQAFTQKLGTSPADGRGTSYRITLSLNWAMMKGARIINMSFSGPKSDDQLARMIAKGDQAGIIFIAAAGNDGPQAPPAFPAAHPSVIAVTAIDEKNALYTHANVGDYVDLAAPGVGIMAAARDGAYDLANGTSFAAPHVSAVAALILSKSPRMDRSKLLGLLRDTAADLGPPGPDVQFGAGCINALEALTRMSLLTSGNPP